ncbi:MAG: HAD domain-containing protein [Clostridia bacterium]|nr:HAD domain-containing protein [Clostridia bacterium]
MKVIFLDVDGVLNSEIWNENHKEEIIKGILIDEDKVRLLKKVIIKTGAVIVLHSGWKYWFDKDIKPIKEEAKKFVEMLKKYDIAIYDVTPDFSTDEIRKTKKFSLVKAKEILHWLKKHKETEKWIVIDDLDLYNEEVRINQLITNNKTGLTQSDAEKIISAFI